MSTMSWKLDERATAGRENLDPDHVLRYDRIEDADAVAEARLCAELGADVVVDIGAGTGQFALAMAPMCTRVVAVDVSPVMLERLRAKAADEPTIEVVEAGFLTYEHTGTPADLVYSRWALHHLPDFWKAIALARVHRTLRPDGVFRLSDVVFDFDPSEAEERIEAWCSTVPVDPDGWTRADLEEHVRDEYSTYTWLLEPMLERTGFEIEGAEHSTDGIFAKYVLRRR